MIQVLQNTGVKLEINWEHKRVKHSIERMWLRGVSVRDAEEVIVQGKKALQRETGLVQAMFERYSVVYHEKVYLKLNLRRSFL